MNELYRCKWKALSQSADGLDNVMKSFQDNLKTKLRSVEEINSFLWDDVYKILYDKRSDAAPSTLSQIKEVRKARK